MAAPTPAGTIYADVREGIGWIEISNPVRRNALSSGMMADLEDILRRLDADPAVRVLILRGEGTAAFAAGADISELEKWQTAEETRREADETTASLFGALAELNSPLLAMVHGHCLGAGLEVALGADFRIADDRSRFAIPAARLGIGYPLPLVRSLVRTAGPGHASEILFTGRSLSAAEALNAGLVNRVVPAAELEDVTSELASMIAVNAPLSIRAAKAAIRATADAAVDNDAERLIDACTGSDDIFEGLRAFMEKRPAQFIGR